MAELLRDSSDSPNYLTIPRADSFASDQSYDSYGNYVQEEDRAESTSKELVHIAKAALPLSFTFFFEYLLAVNSLFFIGHLGPIELASASLAVMTFNITGMAAFEGMATCLDTFCSQAYGAQKYHKVGMYFQRCTLMIFTLSIPILCCWWWSKALLAYLVPEKQLLDQTQLYLRILCLGAPPLITFETGKRFLQAQKIYHGSTYVLAFCLPLNFAMNFTFIKFWGFIGAPVAIVTTYWLMALLILVYIAVVDGKQCWGGFSKRAFKKWRPMLNLALPGLIMIESEYLSFEILTLLASYFGTNSLAAQSIISNIGSLLYQIPFAVGCAVSTRLAIFIGRGSIEPAKQTVRTSLLISGILAFFDFSVVILFKRPLSLLFTSDSEVLAITTKVLPILALNQFADTFNMISAAILRSQGRQKIGSYLNIFAYYVVAMPLCFLLAFRSDLEVSGLWIGLGTGVLILGISETICAVNPDWPKIMHDAFLRNEDDYDQIVIDDSTDVSSVVSSFSDSYD